jgi:uncharacterized membrane protein YccC
MTVYFITYAVVAATVAVGTFAFVGRHRDATTSPGVLTVAGYSVALGAVWPLLPLAVAQMSLIAWYISSLRRHDENLGRPVVSLGTQAGTSSASSTFSCYRS